MRRQITDSLSIVTIVRVLYVIGSDRRSEKQLHIFAMSASSCLHFGLTSKVCRGNPAMRGDDKRNMYFAFPGDCYCSFYAVSANAANFSHWSGSLRR